MYHKFISSILGTV